MSAMFARSLDKMIARLQKMHNEFDADSIKNQIRELSEAATATHNARLKTSLTNEVEKLQNQLNKKGKEYVNPMLQHLIEVRTVIQGHPDFAPRAPRTTKGTGKKSVKGKK